MFSRLGAAEVGAEGLLDHDPRARRPAGAGDALGDPPEERRRDLQVEQCSAMGAPNRGGHGGVGRVVAEVTIDVAEQSQHPGSRRGVRVYPVEAQGRGGVVAELPEVPAALGHPDHRHVQHTPVHETHQRGKGLQLRQVTGCAEDDERVHLIGCRHQDPPARRAWAVDFERALSPTRR